VKESEALETNSHRPKGFSVFPRLNVEFSDLRGSARQLSDWRHRSSHIFDAGHAVIEDATSSGWVGDSHAAMEAALEKMRRSAAALTGDLGDQSTRFSSAAAAYHGGEAVSAAAFTRLESGVRFTNL